MSKVLCFGRVSVETKNSPYEPVFGQPPFPDSEISTNEPGVSCSIVPVFQNQPQLTDPTCV